MYSEFTRWISTSSLDKDYKQKFVWPLENEVDRDRAEWKKGREFLSSHPARIPGLLLGKGFRLLWPIPKSNNRLFRLAVATGQCFLLPFTVIGLLLVLSSADRRQAFLPLLIQLLCLLIATIVFYGSARFRAPYEPFMAILAALPLHSLLLRLTRQVKPST